MTNGMKINANRDFTEVAKDLHAQFKETGGKGGVRMDGQGLYVKNNSETWDKHVALTGDRLKERHDKFDNAARALSDSMDREFKGIMVGDKTVGEYVLGNFLATDGVHRVDEAMLTALEEKLEEALSIALASAFDKGDQYTINTLANRQQVLEAVERHKDDPAAAERQMGWRDKLAGYNALRDALAEDLHAAVSYGQVNSKLGDLGSTKPGPDLGQDPSLPDHLVLRPQADAILRQIDMLHMGLTNASIDKVMKALSDVQENGENYKGGNFKMLEGLYDKVRMNNAVDVAVSEAPEIRSELLNMAHTLYRQRDMQFDDFTKIRDALMDNVDLITALRAYKADSMLYNDEAAKMFSEWVGQNAGALFEALGSYVDSTSANMSEDGAGGASAQEKAIVQSLREYTVKTYDLAKALLPEEDRLDPSVGFHHAALFKPKDVDAVHGLMKKSIREGEINGKLEPFQQKLTAPESLYQRHPAQNGVLNPIDTHNENIELVKGSLALYLTYRDQDTLDGVRTALDTALKSYYHLAAHMQRGDQASLGKHQLLNDNDKLILAGQGFLLQQISAGVDALKEDILSDGLSGVRSESVRSDSIDETFIDYSEVDPDDLPDLPQDDYPSVVADDGSDRSRSVSIASDVSSIFDVPDDNEVRQTTQNQGESNAAGASEVPRGVVEQWLASDTANRFPASYRPSGAAQSGSPLPYYNHLRNRSDGAAGGGVSRSNEMSGGGDTVRDDQSVSTQNAEPLNNELAEDEFAGDEDVLTGAGQGTTPGWDGEARKLNPQNAAAPPSGRERADSDEDMYNPGTPTPGGDDKVNDGPPKGQTMHNRV